MAINSYCSLSYLVFFLPAVALLYSIVPKKYRWIVLLLSSYFFFFSISQILILYLFFTTLLTFGVGLLLSKLNDQKTLMLKDCEKARKKEIKNSFMKKQSAVVAVSVIINIGLLAVLKYTKFFAGNINDIFELLKVPVVMKIPKIAAPVGISFYTLQAVSYIFDVQRGKIKADKNLGRFALYMSFFPSMMEGPICRYSETAEQIWKGEKIHWQNLTFGLQRALFGVMKKIVIADRLNLFVKLAYSEFNQLDGGLAAAAAVLYTCQLYMEFSGTMDIVIGTAEIFGVRLPENFRQPFFSKTISEFWQRWHITLGTWFKDYIFYPMSMSKPLRKLTSKARKKLGNYYGPMIVGAIALFCVWFSNGLWHGAGWRYIFFGMYHFVLILGGNLITPPVKAITERLKINRNSMPYRIMQIIRTSILVCIGELFFRGDGLRAGLVMFKKIVTDFSLGSVFGREILSWGMDVQDYLITGITVLIVLAVSIANEKGISVRERIAKRPLPVRWTIWILMIMYIVIFGAYGAGYIPLDPIYAGF